MSRHGLDAKDRERWRLATNPSPPLGCVSESKSNGVIHNERLLLVLLSTEMLVEAIPDGPGVIPEIYWLAVGNQECLASNL